MQIKHTGKNLLLAFLAAFIYQVVATGLILVGWMVFPMEVVDAHYFMADSIITTVLLVLYGVWLAKICRREQISMISGETFHRPGILIVIAVVLLGMNGLSGFWLLFADNCLSGIPFIADSLQSFDETWSTLGNEAYIWSFLSVVLVGPIVEEVLFRGIVFHYLEKVRSGWFAILVSGIAFGVWHGEPIQVVYAAMIGVVYGMIYFKTRDLRLTIVLHVLNNFLSTLPPAIDVPVVQGVIAVASYIMVIPALVVLWKVCTTQSTQTDTEPAE